MRKLTAVFLLTALFLSFFTGCTTVESEEYELGESDEPVPYEEDEFPDWAKDLRRAEIIFAGSLPFTIMLSNAGYGVYGMLTSESGSGDITSFTTSTTMTNDEKFAILLTGAGLSAGLALVDWIIGLFGDGEAVEQN